MKTKLVIIGTSNNIVELQRVGGGFSAFAEGSGYGNVGDIIELSDKDYVAEGEFSDYQRMLSAYAQES